MAVEWPTPMTVFWWSIYWINASVQPFLKMISTLPKLTPIKCRMTVALTATRAPLQLCLSTTPLWFLVSAIMLKSRPRLWNANTFVICSLVYCPARPAHQAHPKKKSPNRNVSNSCPSFRTPLIFKMSWPNSHLSTSNRWTLYSSKKSFDITI